MAKRDKRARGSATRLYGPGVDLERIRRDRLGKVQSEIASRDIGALLLTVIINIRYANGLSAMPLWTAANLAHYQLAPVGGSPVIYE